MGETGEEEGRKGKGGCGRLTWQIAHPGAASGWVSGRKMALQGTRTRAGSNEIAPDATAAPGRARSV